MSNLTLIIPTKKEAESLPEFLQEIKNLEYIKLIVLQKEDIETKNAIKNFDNVKILEQKNNGYGNALIEGINNTETEYCCIINADGSMDPKYLKEMLTECKNQDFVFGSINKNLIGFLISKHLLEQIFTFIFFLYFQILIGVVLQKTALTLT